MKVFTKLRQYGAPSASHHADIPDSIYDIQDRSLETCRPLGLPDISTHNQTLMWVTTSPTQPQSLCASCWRHFYRLAQPTVRTLGQCMFGIAMLFIMTGIALCIWGFVGDSIKPFQIYGPVCIGAGFFIYIIGCVLCCREYPAFERILHKKARQEKTRRAVDLLGDKDVVEWIQNEPEVYDFREVATRILHQQCGCMKYVLPSSMLSALSYSE